MNTIGDLNIDDFCKDFAKSLIFLYKRFPVSTTLFVEDISGPDEPDEFGLHSPRFEACFSALVWLKEADYIDYKSTIRQEAIEEATLSHRSLRLLSALDQESLTQDNTTRTRVGALKACLSNGSSEELKHLVLSYMGISRTLA